MALPSSSALQHLGLVRAKANQACLQFLGHLQLSAEIRIWPHHVDTGVYAGIRI